MSSPFFCPEIPLARYVDRLELVAYDIEGNVVDSAALVGRVRLVEVSAIPDEISLTFAGRQVELEDKR